MTTVPEVAPAVAVDTAMRPISWAAILAGAAAAIAVGIVLVALGSGLGLAAAAPGARAPSMSTFGALIAGWLVLSQWIASALGGYIAGRLRTRWNATHWHEVFFRDTAHGFLAWAVAAIAAAVIVGPAIAGTVANAPAAAAAADPDDVRKATAAFSIVSSLAMAVGAFIASVAAAIGGHERDLHP